MKARDIYSFSDIFIRSKCISVEDIIETLQIHFLSCDVNDSLHLPQYSLLPLLSLPDVVNYGRHSTDAAVDARKNCRISERESPETKAQSLPVNKPSSRARPQDYVHVISRSRWGRRGRCLGVLTSVPLIVLGVRPSGGEDQVLENRAKGGRWVAGVASSTGHCTHRLPGHLPGTKFRDEEDDGRR